MKALLENVLELVKGLLLVAAVCSAVVLLGIVGVVAFLFVGDPLCDNTVVARIPSPSGRVDAVLYERSCGATTPFSSQVSIVSAGRAPKKAGNLFGADADHGAAETGFWGGPRVAVQWTGPDSLVIRYAVRTRVFSRNLSVMGVRVSYETF